MVDILRSPASRYRKRLKKITGSADRSRPGDAHNDASSLRRKQIQGRLRELEKQRQNSARFSLQELLIQAGIKVSQRKFYVLSAATGLVLGLVYLVLGYPVYGVVPVVIVGALGLPRWWVKRLAKKRQKLFTKNFANAVDVIVRGVQSGLPVNECLNIIAREAPEPVSSEFQQITEGVKIGQTLDEVLERGTRRIPTTEYRFFAIVLAIQQQTGGNLAETLSGLSNVLRDRKKMQDKIKSMTSEARTTALIIGSLPFIMTAIMTLTSYEYISILWQETIGHWLIAGGIVLIVSGTLIMNRMIKFEV